MSQKITVQINFFGPYLKKEDIPKILEQKPTGAFFELQNDLLKYFFDFPLPALSQEILERYIETTTEESHTPIVPHTKEIFERLLRPLKSAKKNYCLGEYPATIALCGVVGEMLAILLWIINDVRLKGQPITEKEEAGLFGKCFEKLGQDQRLKILRTFGHINEQQYNSFDLIRRSRRPYLHLWTTNLTNEKEEALDIFKKTFQLFKEVTGIGLADAGSVKVNPLLLKLFENQNTQN